jgi:hypothetical protein
MKIYVASSFRNLLQPVVVTALRKNKHDVYDFKDPETGFRWSSIDPNWQSWTPRKFEVALHHPLTIRGFDSDAGALAAAECCVLVLPCGASAHLEAGWAQGAGKPVIVLVPDAPLHEIYDVKATEKEVPMRPPWEPELMYRWFAGFATTVKQVVSEVNRISLHRQRERVPLDPYDQ